MSRFLPAAVWALLACTLGIAFWNLRGTPPGREWLDHPGSFIALSLALAFILGSEIGKAYARLRRGGFGPKPMLSLLYVTLLAWACGLGYQRIVGAQNVAIGEQLGTLWIALFASLALLGTGYGRLEHLSQRREVAR
ncbi:hypothetical protein [Burkholderia alba]|uniref:hypothetical protein n=1 Tax=Burkholderia alba TaxID=2683677 RepID=UPI002B059FAB|nr:hypothetical protein [Burkholderia alba]